MSGLFSHKGRRVVVVALVALVGVGRVVEAVEWWRALDRFVSCS